MYDFLRKEPVSKESFDLQVAQKKLATARNARLPLEIIPTLKQV